MNRSHKEKGNSLFGEVNTILPMLIMNMIVFVVQQNDENVNVNFGDISIFRWKTDDWNLNNSTLR